MAWSTTLTDYDEFLRAMRDPEMLFVAGYLGTASSACTLASLMEEFDQVLVEGPTGWRAKLWRDGRRIKAIRLR